MRASAALYFLFVFIVAVELHGAAHPNHNGKKGKSSIADVSLLGSPRLGLEFDLVALNIDMINPKILRKIDNADAELAEEVEQQILHSACHSRMAYKKLKNEPEFFNLVHGALTRFEPELHGSDLFRRVLQNSELRDMY